MLIDSDRVIQIHAAWALGQIGGIHAKEVLTKALFSNKDDEVIAEILNALDTIKSSHDDKTSD